MKRPYQIVTGIFMLGLAIGALYLHYYLNRSPSDVSSDYYRHRRIQEMTPKKCEYSPTKTLLLTGFEPFGGSPKNASWEGVALLDGKTICGYSVVTAQMPVVWDKPLELLREQISRNNPTAVFSFGQAPGNRFLIETYARNQREIIPDNKNNAPGGLTVLNGKDSYRASNPCIERVVRKLSQTYPLALSENAGNYLCEECLYSLEYLHEKYRSLDVMFCHVPTLGGRTPNGIEVTPQYISEFIEALIDECMTDDNAVSDTAKQ